MMPLMFLDHCYEINKNGEYTNLNAFPVICFTEQLKLEKCVGQGNVLLWDISITNMDEPIKSWNLIVQCTMYIHVIVPS